MALVDKTQIGQPVPPAPPLPGRYGALPEKLAKAFPEFAEYHQQNERLYKLVREAVATSHTEIALPVAKIENENRSIKQSFISVTTDVGTLTARIDAEEIVRAADDAALALRTSNLEASVDTAGTGLLARVTTIEGAYVDSTEATAISNSAITASLTGPSGSIYAAVLTESTARATADGFLGGKYTLSVIAGDIVTGMNITSSTGSGTDVSDVTFQASSFKIYNNTSGVAPFQVASGQVRVSNLTILNTDVSGLGALATANSVAYGDITGTKPPSNADVTLTAINGGLSLTGGGLILASGGAAIRGGQTAFNTGAGFWLGDDGGTTKFSIGNPAGNRLTWDGSSLAITGAITLTNSIAAGSVTGLAATATSSDYSSVTGTKPPSNADVTLSAINGGLTITGGGLTLNGTPTIKSNDYSPGTSGWAIKGDGAVEFSSGEFRGTVNAAAITASTIVGGSIDIPSTGAVNISYSTFQNLGPETGIGLELGYYRTLQAPTWIDFHTQDAPRADYNARIIRNEGPNGHLEVDNQGSGDIQLKPASGRVSFGTFTSDYQADIDYLIEIEGYIEIKDAGGTVRRLACLY